MNRINSLRPDLTDSEKLELQKLVEKLATEAGFQIVDKPLNAHVILNLGVTTKVMGENKKFRSLGDNEEKIIPHVSRGLQSKYVQELYLAIWIQDHGKRISIGPDLILGYNDVSSGPHREKLLSAVAENFGRLDLKAPAENKKMAGAPGCMPRFGFIHKSVWRNGYFYQAVKSVKPGSPAAKIGLKPEDLVLAVDSVSDFSSAELDKSYESFTPVPIKFWRDGKTFRKTIRPVMMCDNDWSYVP